ncbi:hypothetical protein [Ascidiaceihabitans sp.]|uniref:hypothetical protein n=1 Tax=Ascidiaceihabitans sp. TaxID=1872644 RepID=UPI0032982D49
MTPKFALSLSYDGIRLAYRANDGWQTVGDVAFDTADLTGALADLRAQAEDIAPGNVACKLIIPDDQIKFLALDHSANNSADDTARAALDGATPYAVEDLAYDVSTTKHQIFVAAVAKETLAEAHAFATEHKFNPVSAVAQPDATVFIGEPFFGPTGDAQNINRHDDLVIIAGPYIAPAPAVVETVEDDIQPAPAKPDVPDVDVSASASQQTLVDDGELLTKRPDDIAAASDAETPQTATSDALDDDSPASNAGKNPQNVPLAVGFASRRALSGGAPSLAGVARDDVPATKAPVTKPVPATAPQSKATQKPKVDIVAATIPIEEDTSAIASAGGAASTAAASAAKQAMRFLSRRKPAKTAPPVAKAAPAAAAIATAPTSEAQRLTVFGARKSDPIVVGGKPRFLGLILTATLLVFLAGVAAWATVFMDDGLARFFGKDTQTPTLAAPAEIIPQNATTEEATTVVASLDPTLSPEDAAVLDALQDPLPEPELDQPDLSLAEQEARYAVTGIWPVAPSTPEPASLVSLDDLYVTGIDPLSPAQDAVALPDTASYQSDLALAAVPAPAAAGTAYTLDDRGWVIPTPEGAVTPDNVTVYLGRPPVVPPTRPAAPEAAPEIDTATAALAGFRPKSRPSDLVENTERSNLGGVTLSELGGLRPRLRPGVQRTTEEQEIEDAPEVIENPLATATKLATAASARPDTRPRNFARIVARARQKQADAPAAETTRVAAVAPRTVTPKIPTAASVAKEATVRNAINLGRVNLIGVSGKPSSRRALVRLANGRMKPVKVGDRIDGGRVTAIGDAELRYQKGSRNLVLKMPKG